MKSLRYFIVLICICLTSCVSVPSPVESKPTPEREVISLLTFPAAPTVKDYTRKPILEKTENNFLVSDEFLENSVLLYKYYHRVEEWKDANKIK